MQWLRFCAYGVGLTNGTLQIFNIKLLKDTRIARILKLSAKRTPRLGTQGLEKYMGYNISNYSGDAEYPISCTGDAVVGDEVRFERATFSGSFRNAKFDGFEQITGKIIVDSYGREKQQHTFTLRLSDESTLRIKGRNLYKEGVWRKQWADESIRHEVADEKHVRGDHARAMRENRRSTWM